MLDNRNVLWGLIALSVVIFFVPLAFQLAGATNVPEVLLIFSFVLFVTTVPLIILSFAGEHPLIKWSKKVFKITLVLGILVYVGAIILALVAGWGEVGYAFYYGTVYFGPVLGLLYVIAVLIGIIGFFKIDDKTNRHRNAGIILIVCCVVILTIFLIRENAQSFSHKKMYKSLLADMPIYSQNGECVNTDYVALTGSEGNKLFSLQCEYDSVYALNETYNKHRAYILSKNGIEKYEGRLGLDYHLKEQRKIRYTLFYDDKSAPVYIDYNAHPRIRIIFASDGLGGAFDEVEEVQRVDPTIPR